MAALDSDRKWCCKCQHHVYTHFTHSKFNDIRMDSIKR